MKLTVIKVIGRREYPFEFEGSNLHECIMESQKLSFPDVLKCGMCDSDNLRLNAYITKEKKFEYTNVLCECGASVTFGQKQEDSDVFYLRRNDDKKLDWKAREDDSPKSESPQKEEKGEMNQEQIDYIELLAGNVVLSQDVKDRLGRFVKAEKTSFEAESTITSVISLIGEAEGTVPDRNTPY